MAEAQAARVSFAFHFRQHVVPQLRTAAKVEAICVKYGGVSFDEAYGEIFKLARNRGALHLPPAVLTDLDDWITTELVTAIDALGRPAMADAE